MYTGVTKVRKYSNYLGQTEEYINHICLYTTTWSVFIPLGRLWSSVGRWYDTTPIFFGFF